MLLFISFDHPTKTLSGTMLKSIFSLCFSFSSSLHYQTQGFSMKFLLWCCCFLHIQNNWKNIKQVCCHYLNELSVFNWTIVMTTLLAFLIEYLFFTLFQNVNEFFFFIFFRSIKGWILLQIKWLKKRKNSVHIIW